MRFSSINEAMLAYFHKVVDLQARIQVYVPNKDIYGEEKNEGVSLVITTPGNIMFNEDLPKNCSTSIRKPKRMLPAKKLRFGI